MANVYSRMSTDASVGTTIGTFDAINTRNADNVMHDNSREILGLYFAGVAADQTTATATAGRLRARSAGADISAGTADFAVGESHGAGIATQSIGWWTPAEFIPFKVVKPTLKNVTFNLDFSQMGIEPADNWSVVAGIANAAAKPQFWNDQVSGAYTPDGSVSSNGAGVSATTATSLGTTTIVSKFKRLVTWRPFAVADPLGTTTEETVGFASLDTAATTISGLTPCELPMPAIGPYLLGTLVGGGVGGFQYALPMYVEKEDSDKTLDVVLSLTTAVTAANAFAYSVGVSY
jgi:hypothetical protein